MLNIRYMLLLGQKTNIIAHKLTSKVQLFQKKNLKYYILIFEVKIWIFILKPTCTGSLESGQIGDDKKMSKS